MGGADVKRRLAALLVCRGHGWVTAEAAAAPAPSAAPSASSPAPANALECFTEAARLEPLNAKYWVLKAGALCRMSGPERNLDAALHAVDQAVSLAPNEAEWHILRGKIHWALGLTDAGNKDLSVAAALAPDHAEVVLWLEAQWVRSAALYDEATALMGPGAAPAQLAAATERLTAALALQPDDLKLRLTRAAAHRRGGFLDAALADLDEATAAFFAASAVADGADAAATAAQALGMREPVQITRQRSLVLNDMAIRAITAGDHRRALTLLNRAIDSEQRLFLHSQKAAEAAARAAAAGGGPSGGPTAAPPPVDYRYFVNRGDCYRALGKLEHAISDFHRAFDANPADEQVRTRLAVLHYLLGTDLFNEGEFGQSEVEFSVAIKYNDRVANFFASRGKAYYYQHRFGAAHADYRRALGLDPSLEDVRVRLKQFEPNEATARGIDSQRLAIVAPSREKEAAATFRRGEALARDTADIERVLPRINHRVARLALPAAKIARRKAQAVQAYYGEGRSIARDEGVWSMMKAKPAPWQKRR